MSVIGAFKDKDNNKIFPLSSASIKLDYVNSVDLSNINTDYTIPNDGELVTDSGCVVVNKGNVIRNTDKEYIIYIPYRHSCILPEETTASNIKCNDSTGELSNIQSVINNSNNKLESLTNKVGEVPQGTSVEAQITNIDTNLAQFEAATNNALSLLNTNLAKLNVVHTDIGGNVPLYKGGTSIKIDQFHLYKMGNLLLISMLTWGSPVTNPTADALSIKLPYTVLSVRNYGFVGYNSSGVYFYPVIISDTNTIGFATKATPQSNEVGLTGNNMANGTWQAMAVCIVQ